MGYSTYFDINAKVKTKAEANRLANRVIHKKIDFPHRRVYIFCNDGLWYNHKRVS